MTIAERIQLHKLGYTKEEIKELINADYDPKGLEDPPKSVDDGQTVPDPEPDTPEMPVTDGQPKPDTQMEILKALQGLTATIQQSNIIKSRQPEQSPETAEDILSKLL